MFKVAIYLLIFIFIVIFILPFFYTVSAFDLNPKEILAAPSFSHLFGTDRLGRDVLARVLIGGQTSLIIGILSATIASFIGLLIGITAGYFKGKVDKSIVILIDLFLTFPTFFLLLALVSYIQASTIILIIVISITGWMSMARLIRSESFAISNKPFIKIQKLANVSNTKIIFKYFAPLLAPIFLISFTFLVGGSILSESALSFLGLGINPPDMSWGTLLSDGKAVIDIAWWVSFFPGLFIFLVTFCLIQISDYLQKIANTKEVIN
ncbi:ABC transporter permease [Malaciobacter molluscorum LMG 25693]|uniref:ABC transporter permease n=1 Tax=Malaciobacter molluscorum LMG 25693 TaxID=870501 RepID=A0A2G1DEV9_9BACT|nr:ABC transporter permease [Malaciobacter molluscorum]AXX92787.1 ABC transporter, permease protein [Malaciobacter molluscorum LMG 25693]PHO17019.1 ABC transporter permease [Malaciobacter molluscorum LMG 25693]